MFGWTRIQSLLYYISVIELFGWTRIQSLLYYMSILELFGWIRIQSLLYYISVLELFGWTRIQIPLYYMSILVLLVANQTCLESTMETPEQSVKSVQKKFRKKLVITFWRPYSQLWADFTINVKFSMLTLNKEKPVG